MHIPFFFLIILFVLWLGYEVHKNNRAAKDSSKEFWARESEALMTPRKPIDDVKFIEIPDEIIPAKSVSPDNDTEREINELISELEALKKRQIADLSDYTNTDLRLKYGTVNFTRLSNADTAFARVVQIMPALISNLKTSGRTEEADVLLQFCERANISSNAINKLKNEP